MNDPVNPKHREALARMEKAREEARKRAHGKIGEEARGEVPEEAREEVREEVRAAPQEPRHIQQYNAVAEFLENAASQGIITSAQMEDMLETGRLGNDTPEPVDYVRGAGSMVRAALATGIPELKKITACVKAEKAISR